MKERRLTGTGVISLRAFPHLHGGKVEAMVLLSFILSEPSRSLSLGEFLATFPPLSLLPVLIVTRFPSQGNGNTIPQGDPSFLIPFGNLPASSCPQICQRLDEDWKVFLFCNSFFFFHSQTGKTLSFGWNTAAKPCFEWVRSVRLIGSFWLECLIIT